MNQVLEKALERTSDGVLGVRITLLPRHVFDPATGMPEVNAASAYYVASDAEALLLVSVSERKVPVAMRMNTPFVLGYDKISCIHVLRGA